MLYFLLFILELLLLFFLSKKLINSLARLIFRLTKSHQMVVRILAILFLPGTIIHELAHLLFAGVMLVPVGEINVIPEIEGAGVRLGSVQIGKTDPFRRTIAGVAPVLLGMILIFSIFVFVKIGVSPWWQIILAIYLLFEIGNTMFSSKKDIENSVLFIILILVMFAVILAALYSLNPGFLQATWAYLSNLDLEFAANFFKQALIYLLVPVSLDLLVILSTRLFL